MAIVGPRLWLGAALLIAAPWFACCAEADGAPAESSALFVEDAAVGAADGGGVGSCWPGSCPAGEDCIGGKCIQVECSAQVTCTEAGELCDTFARKCYPSNGECKEADACPRFGLGEQHAAAVSCDKGFCRVAPAPPTWIPGLRWPNNELQLLAPAHGAVLTKDADLAVEWVATDASVFAYLLSERPTSSNAIADLAIWAGSVGKGGTPKLRFEDGVAVDTGRWRTRTAPLPTNTPLYLLLQAVSKGAVVGASKPVQLRVGDPWPANGDACAISPTTAAPCASPLEQLGCHKARCRRLCLSHADCAGVGHTCGALDGDFRLCVDP